MQKKSTPGVVEAASCRFEPVCALGFFDPALPIANLDGNLPHFRQEGVTYFVTFRTADSIPQEKLKQWCRDRDEWLKAHPEPHTPEMKREYFERFPERIQQWLDGGYGECLLARPEVRRIVVEALEHFDGERYELRSWVVMPNHIHAVVTLSMPHELSEVMHSWKSFSATAINRLLGRCGQFWQKESFDHIVRSAEALERIEIYISENPRGLPADAYSLSAITATGQDAASTGTAQS